MIMPEDSGKQKFIQNFLQKVKSGEGFVEDIWVERNIRTPGSSEEGSTARSLSARKITNITELIEDDIRHCFYDGYFTFRIISAAKGSGKTSLLSYLHELIKSDSIRHQKFIISKFPITALTLIGGKFNFTLKLYYYILAETFWNLVKSSEHLIQNKAKELLGEYLQSDEVNRLVSARTMQAFRAHFTKSFSEISINFEEFLFDVMGDIFKIDPQYVFVYLIDELDGLEHQVDERQQVLVVIRSLVKGVAQRFDSRIRLFIYLVGTTKTIDDFFREDQVLESLVSNNVINLNNVGYKSEVELIKVKINDRIKGAFKGYRNFDTAWLEIQQISLKPSLNLRNFCQEYSRSVLEIYEKHFKEEPEKCFEGKARDLVLAQSRQHWKRFLTQNSYTLSEVSTTTILENHAFDCYVELLHNGVRVGRCFGEAKNYELLSSHLATFDQWLRDVRFRGSVSDPTFDLAFMIAPSCPALLQRKLDLKNIHFIQSDKIQSDKVISIPSTTVKDNSSTNQVIQPNLLVELVDLNTSSDEAVRSAFKGMRIQTKIINDIVKNRPFSDIEDLGRRIKITNATKDKLKSKFSFSFQLDVFT